LKVLIVGSGGREHALAWKLDQSPEDVELYAAPGSDAISRLAKCLPYKATDIDGIVDAARSNKIGLAVIGPEDPLVGGITPKLRGQGIEVFGHSPYASMLEGSKSFAKEIMNGSGVPTAYSQTFDNYDLAISFIEDKWDEFPDGWVIKADGLAKGKGVILPEDLRQAKDVIKRMMRKDEFGPAGKRVVIEEKLLGEEASIINIANAYSMFALPPSQDHKPVFDGDLGPNTGGMGAYSPAPVITEELNQQIQTEIMERTRIAMNQDGKPLEGCLYAGLMITNQGPRVLEFNVRFGDPETQPILIRLNNDLFKIIYETVNNPQNRRLEKIRPDIDPRPAVCVVMASGGYPGDYEKGKRITGLDKDGQLGLDDVYVFHAGTKFEGGKWYTNGGRVLGVTALGNSADDYQGAIDRAYDAVDRIYFEGMQFRKDIGKKAFMKR
jgi:phosphoribosylamine--glycine ligase